MNYGTQIALFVPECPQLHAISPNKLQNLQNLTDALKSEVDSGMLRSTAAQISNCLNRPPSEITIEQVATVQQQLRAFLDSRRYRRNTVRTYLNHVNLLVTRAKELGWTQSCPEVEHAWQNIIPVMSNVRGARGVIGFAIRRKLTPAQFSDAIFDTWQSQLLSRGRTVDYVSITKSAFRKGVFESGLGEHFPELSPPQGEGDYGVPFSKLPDALAAGIRDMIKWKTDAFSVGRPAKARLRPISAMSLQGILCRVYGFAKTVMKVEISSLQELVSKEITQEYVVWCINDRKQKGETVLNYLGMLNSLIKTYPPLGKPDREWLISLIAGLPYDTANLVRERKAHKWVDYDELAELPEKIRRAGEHYSDSKRIAVSGLHQLIMKWLTILPWRKQNLINCRLGKREEGANVFKEEIPASAAMRKPKWVEDAIRANPHEKIWQFYFRPHETKNGGSVQGVVPKELVPLLEEHLVRFRPALVKGNDPLTLLVNGEGRRFSGATFYRLVRNLTRRFTGRAVNPHLFRDILAVKWLREHPRDYLTLSKMLWHRDLKTTIRTYGQNFDESDGAVAVDEWLERRSSIRKDKNS